MALTLTENAINATSATNIKPSLVLQIEGVSTLYGAVTIQKYIHVGDVGLLVDGSWLVGGLGSVIDQEDLISLDGTGTSITQQLLPDKGSVSSASSVSVQLIDADNLLTQLISPSIVVEDVLGRNAKLYMGFQGTAWPDDFVEIFRGYIDDIISGAGFVRLNIVHPEKKKMQDVFTRKDDVLSAGINSAVTSLPVVNANTKFLFHYVGPDGSFNFVDCQHYVRIDDEIIEYLGLTATNITGAVRGSLGTTAAAHSSGAKVTSFYAFEEDVVNLALKLMLSGPANKTELNFKTGVVIKSFNVIDASLTVSNAVFFLNVNISEEYGLTEGDYIQITGATDSANNDVTPGWAAISSIVVSDTGSYAVVSGVTFTDETTTSAVAGFRSRYDTFPDGLGMTPAEVDITEHNRWRDLQLSAFSLRIYVRDTINGKEFLDKEVYSPYGAYSIPRKGKSSMGFHIGPLPTVDIKILGQDEIKNASKLQLRRTTSRNFYNAIAYKFDESAIEEGKFLSGVITVDADSQSRIPVGNAVFTIESRGIRTNLSGVANTALAAARRLNRYKFAAESIDNAEVFFGDGFNLEPGDLLIVDFDGLQVSNSSDGTREKPEKFYEVTNKRLDLKTGNVSLTLLDTNFTAGERYGLISPSSVVATGGLTTSVILQDSYGAIFPGNEKKKWADYVGLPVLVHSANFTFSEEVTFTGFDAGNPYKMNFDAATPLSLAAVAGQIVDIAPYSTNTDPSVNRLYKLIHAHQSPRVAVVSGSSSTVFVVSAGNAGKFIVGAYVRVHTTTFTDFSPEVKVSIVSGTTITVAATLGFTPSSSHWVSFIGFADSEQTYRFI